MAQPEFQEITHCGGQFIVNGVPQTGGHEIDIAPAELPNTVFNVGTLGGSDTLYAQLLQWNGQLTAWKSFTVSAPVARLSSLSVFDDPSAVRGAPVALAAKAAGVTRTISDPPSSFARNPPRIWYAASSDTPVFRMSS